MAPLVLGLLAVAVPERHWYDVYAAADAARDAALAAGRGGAVMQPPLGAVALGGDVGAGSLDARAAVVDGEERGGRPMVGGKGCGSYLIVSMQRSGTTTICTDINNIKGKFKKRPGQATNSSVGDFVCQYELLNSGELQSGHRFLEETNHTPAWAAKHPQEMVRQAAQKARNKWGACVWGFKIFDKQLAAVDQIVDRFDKCIIYRCARPMLASPLFSRSAHLSHTPLHAAQEGKHHCAVPLVEDGRGDGLLGDHSSGAGGKPCMCREGHDTRQGLARFPGKGKSVVQRERDCVPQGGQAGGVHHDGEVLGTEVADLRARGRTDAREGEAALSP